MNVKPPAEQRRLLLVDDDAPLVRALARLLKPDGWVVESYTSPQEALENILSGARYDVILCDVLMPDLDGPGFHACLPADIQNRVIFITGGTIQRRMQRRLQATGAPVFLKPFPLSELLRSIQAQLSVVPRPTPAEDSEA